MPQSADVPDPIDVPGGYDDGLDLPGEAEATDSADVVSDAVRDIADVPAVEIISTAAVHLMSAAAVKCGLADDPEGQRDLDEARKLITALAGLLTAAAPEISDSHARPLRDGLRTLQLAFREASPIPDRDRPRSRREVDRPRHLSRQAGIDAGRQPIAGAMCSAIVASRWAL